MQRLKRLLLVPYLLHPCRRAAERLITTFYIQGNLLNSLSLPIHPSSEGKGFTDPLSGTPRCCNVQVNSQQNADIHTLASSISLGLPLIFQLFQCFFR
jgi:hypothetical protein